MALTPHKRLVLFGGSFDPIHLGHIQIALAAWKYLIPNHFFFVPCNTHPFAKQIAAANHHRLAMLEIALQAYPFFKISSYELTKTTVSYTVDTVLHYAKLYPDHQIYLLIGSDQLVQFTSWHAYQTILEHAYILCYERDVVGQNHQSLVQGGTLKLPGLLKVVKFIPLPGAKLVHSSTACKSSFTNNQLDQKVVAYINKYAVYAAYHLGKMLSNYRKNHCLEVGKIAQDLAFYHAPDYAQQAYVAGVYHDYAKEMPELAQSVIAQKMGVTEYGPWKTWHGHVASYLLQNEFAMSDPVILNAIAHHVLASDDHIVSKIVYVADKLFMRDDDWQQERLHWQELAYNNISLAFDVIKAKHTAFYAQKTIAAPTSTAKAS